MIGTLIFFSSSFPFFSATSQFLLLLNGMESYKYEGTHQQIHKNLSVYKCVYAHTEALHDSTSFKCYTTHQTNIPFVRRKQVSSPLCFVVDTIIYLFLCYFYLYLYFLFIYLFHYVWFYCVFNAPKWGEILIFPHFDILKIQTQDQNWMNSTPKWFISRAVTKAKIIHFDCIKAICTQKTPFVSRCSVSICVNQTCFGHFTYYKFKLAYYFSYFFEKKKILGK